MLLKKEATVELDGPISLIKEIMKMVKKAYLFSVIKD